MIKSNRFLRAIVVHVFYLPSKYPSAVMASAIHLEDQLSSINPKLKGKRRGPVRENVADLIGGTGNSYPSPYGEACSLDSECWSGSVGSTLAVQTESFLAINAAKRCISFQPCLKQFEMLVNYLSGAALLFGAFLVHI